MSKYNLDQQLANLSVKQITKMVELRIQKEHDLFSKIDVLSGKQGNCSNDERYDHLQTKIDRLETKMEDCAEWLNTAKELFSSSLWNKMVDNNESWAK